MLTDEGDVVVDPFAGSCVTGEVCERLKRQWICSELRRDYVEGALGRFVEPEGAQRSSKRELVEYRIARPGHDWQNGTGAKLRSDGGEHSGSALRKKPDKRS
jgi:site-specific DNA-methyltransferase (cytosine-N4-specific)